MVKRLVASEIKMPTGSVWNAHVYAVDVGPSKQFMALCYGKISNDPTLVRVHTGSVPGDAFQVRMGDRVSRRMSSLRSKRRQRRHPCFCRPTGSRNRRRVLPRRTDSPNASRHGHCVTRIRP
ncbi:MAG: hypothetical protein R3A47_08185 [Polyangiales bacterium]